MPIRIAIPREGAAGETRVSMTPDAVRRLASDDVLVAVQAGAGESARFSDEEYREAGARVVADPAELLGEADVILKVGPPTEEELESIGEGSLLAAFLRPHSSDELLQRLAGRKITALSLELIPRITRAQAMDALSSQSNLAGYEAVIVGAGSLGRIFPLLMTAAGTLSPARVLVLGAGVAGLQAIATAKRLGAEVWGYDIRPVVKEQVESLGGKFVELEEEGEAGEELETAGGYAAELAEERQARQRERLARHISKADVVITTALVPGKPAPVLITEEMVRAMKPGSVIVDLAGEAGGNCALSEPGETVEREGVTIHAPLDLATSLPTHASQLLARNFTALLKPMISDGELTVDLEDEVVDAACVAHAGEVRFSA